MCVEDGVWYPGVPPPVREDTERGEANRYEPLTVTRQEILPDAGLRAGIHGLRLCPGRALGRAGSGPALQQRGGHPA